MSYLPLLLLLLGCPRRLVTLLRLGAFSCLLFSPDLLALQRVLAGVPVGRPWRDLEVERRAADFRLRVAVFHVEGVGAGCSLESRG